MKILRVLRRLLPKRAPAKLTPEQHIQLLKEFEQLYRDIDKSKQ